MRKESWAAILAGLTVAVGCATYRPVAVHEARERDARARVTGVRLGWVDVGVDGDSVDPTDSAVRAAWLSPAEAPKCTGGWPGTIVWQGSGVAPASVRRFTLSFARDDARSPLVGDSAIDLQLDAPASSCLRVPFAGHAPTSAWSDAGRWYAGPAVRYAIVRPTIDGAHEAFSIDLRVGRWVGAVRVTGEVGAGLHGCNGTCNDDGFEWLESALGLEGFVARGNGWALGVEGAYTALPGVGHPSSNQSFVHGPRLTVRLVRTEKSYPGLPSGPQVRAHGIELFAAERFFGGDHLGGLIVGLGVTSDDGL